MRVLRPGFAAIDLISELEVPVPFSGFTTTQLYVRVGLWHTYCI